LEPTRVVITPSGKQAPSWWKGPEEAAQQGLALARSLGLSVDLSDAVPADVYAAGG